MKFLDRLKNLFFPSRLYIANFYDAKGYLLRQRIIKARNYKQADSIAFKYYLRRPQFHSVYVEKIEEEEYEKRFKHLSFL